jgi:hypothetical protein
LFIGDMYELLRFPAATQEEGRVMKLRASVLALTALTSLLAAGAALAQDPTGSTYAGVGNDITQQAGVAGVAAQSQGTLPFTGLDLAVGIVLGLVLIAVGVLMRRRSRPVA